MENITNAQTGGTTQTIVSENILEPASAVVAEAPQFSEQSIYYCFSKQTGEFMGSGTPFFDTEEIGCTTTPTPSYNHMNKEMPFWINEAWVVKTKE